MKHPWQALLLGWLLVCLGVVACMRGKHEFKPEATATNISVPGVASAPASTPQNAPAPPEPGRFSAQDGQGYAQSRVPLEAESQIAAEDAEDKELNSGAMKSGREESKGEDEQSEAEDESGLIRSHDHPILRGLEIEEKYFPLVLNRGENRKYSSITGKASFEDEEQRTKSGERFNPEELVGASRRWPMGTIAKCTNLSNDKSVTVQIIDRGPYVDGRVVDLSEAAARKVGMIRKGVVGCRVEVLAYPQEKK